MLSLLLSAGCGSLVCGVHLSDPGLYTAPFAGSACTAYHNIGGDVTGCDPGTPLRLIHDEQKRFGAGGFWVKISSLDQYLGQLDGVDGMVNPPKFGHPGNGLLNTNRLRHFRKQF